MFCFSYAGGTATLYLKWKRYIHPNIHLYPLEIPGRGTRINESLCNTIEDIVDDTYRKISTIVDDGEYAIFGYSMGSLIGFELCRKLKENGHKMPVHLFTAALMSPNLIEKRETIHTLPNEEFLQELIKFNGFPNEIIENKAIMDFYLPILKADFEAIETYTYRKNKRNIDVNITTLYGKDDTVQMEEIHAWANVTTGKHVTYEMMGDHFFILSQAERISGIITETLVREVKTSIKMHTNNENFQGFY
ncbi:thioesterase II family protein [Halalkalibacter urbisdiaboli]|uniref:thioesterase II family protein n=1 Tax=Halalkalibacter urbisdiaboli TaxID=1960589 RepID=UPI0013FDC8C0|nr:thioesterase [Halalkalibacter urbisdiaboli]